MNITKAPSVRGPGLRPPVPKNDVCRFGPILVHLSHFLFGTLFPVD